jgi:hypothetical protein
MSVQGAGNTLTRPCGPGHNGVILQDICTNKLGTKEELDSNTCMLAVYNWNLSSKTFLVLARMGSWQCEGSNGFIQYTYGKICS